MNGILYEILILIKIISAVVVNLKM